MYNNFLNAMLDTGIVSVKLLLGIVKSLYKNKDDPTSPENYRQIHC